jgi:hypothetical protein
MQVNVMIFGSMLGFSGVRIPMKILPKGHINHHTSCYIGCHLDFCLSLGLGGISIGILTPEKAKLEPTSTEKAKGIWLCADHFSAQCQTKLQSWVDHNLTSNPDLTSFASSSVVKALMFSLMSMLYIAS